jgi:hypothetical protein
MPFNHKISISRAPNKIKRQSVTFDLLFLSFFWGNWSTTCGVKYSLRTYHEFERKKKEGITSRTTDTLYNIIILLL